MEQDRTSTLCFYLHQLACHPPLTSLEVVLELISHTTTNEGLAVTAIKDSHTYPTGIKVSDDELAAINLSRHSFHGEWNYTIKPQGS
jgi:hypothetical protein